MVNGEKYIFIRNQDNFVVFRKSADGMIIVKLNQGKWRWNDWNEIFIEFF